jgi:hypothetical protein
MRSKWFGEQVVMTLRPDLHREGCSVLASKTSAQKSAYIFANWIAKVPVAVLPPYISIGSASSGCATASSGKGSPSTLYSA